MPAFSKTDRFEDIRQILHDLGKPKPYCYLIAAARAYGKKNPDASAMECVRAAARRLNPEIFSEEWV